VPTFLSNHADLWNTRDVEDDADEQTSRSTDPPCTTTANTTTTTATATTNNNPDDLSSDNPQHAHLPETDDSGSTAHGSGDRRWSHPHPLHHIFMIIHVILVLLRAM